MPETDELLDATTALIPPLLTAVDALRAAGRHMHPPMLPQLVEAIRPQHGGLVEGFELFKSATWPEHLETFVDCVTRSVGYALRAFAQFEQALEAPQPAFVAYRAMGLTTKAIEALYPVAAMLPPVSRFYLEPQSRDDAELLERLAAVTADKDHVGLMHANNSSDERGGFQFMFQSITPVRPSHWFCSAWRKWSWPSVYLELVACSAFFELYRYRPHLVGQYLVAYGSRCRCSAFTRFSGLRESALEH